MQTFELYGIAWLVYFILGLALLALVAYKVKNLTWPVKFSIISFLAVGALTPEIVTSSIVTNAETYAPLVITSLLKAEVEGSKAIISGLVQLVIVWGIVFFIGMSTRHFLTTRAKR